MFKHLSSWMLVPMCLAITAGSTLAESGATIAQDRNELLSRLQKMTHGYYTEAQWQEAYDEIHRLLDRAEGEGDLSEVIDVSLLLARVQSDMRGRHTDALYLLSRLKDRFLSSAGLPMGRIYSALAEVHAKLGNASAIEQLMAEFRDGPHYDPADHAVSGGTDPSTPVRVVRPDPQGQDSVTLTIMQRHLQQAMLAPGAPFPAFQLTTRAGRSVSNQDFAGRVLLVDFYAPMWPAWQADLTYLKRLYERFQPMGFEILGISLDPSEVRVDALVAEQQLPWPQVVGDRALRRQCGVLGQPRSFLLDGQGQVIARDPSIPQLEDLLADLLGGG